jgi:hypothetical protein
LMQNLATVLDAQGRVTEAKDLLGKGYKAWRSYTIFLLILVLIEEALSIQIEQHGENSIETAVTINNLGVLSAHLGETLFN